jgi:tetratricopeptide (TPR) repeat protein
MYGLDFHEQIEALMDIEAYDEVISRLREDGVFDRDDFLHNWNLGWACFKLDRFELAVVSLERAVELEPTQFAGHFAFGVALEALGRLDEAESSLRTALVLRDSAMARQALAVVMMEKGDFVLAERIHLDGLQTNPDSANRWDGYADFLYDTGRLEEAEAARAKALKFTEADPEDED